MAADRKAYMKAYSAAYYEANKERMKASAKAYRDADVEADKAKQRARRAANVDVVRERDRARLAANRAAINARRRQIAAEKRALGIKRSFDPVLNRIYRSNRRALERNAAGRHTKAEVLAMYDAQGGRCKYCEADLSGGYHKDHIKALARGGSNDIGNIQLLCAPCNQGKSAKDEAEFLALWQSPQLTQCQPIELSLRISNRISSFGDFRKRRDTELQSAEGVSEKPFLPLEK